MINPLRALFDAWRSLSQRLYDKADIANLQKRYDEIKDWEDEDLKRTLTALWSLIPPELQDSMTRFVIALCRIYGEDFARKVIKDMFPNFVEKSK